MTRTTAWALFVGMVNLFLETGFFEKAVFQIAFVVGANDRTTIDRLIDHIVLDSTKKYLP